MEKYQKKVKVSEVIRWDTLSAIHLQTTRQLAAEGINFRLSTPTITQAEDSLNEIWFNCLHGRATLDDFRAINQKWADLIRDANRKSQKTTLLNMF